MIMSPTIVAGPPCATSQCSQSACCVTFEAIGRPGTLASSRNTQRPRKLLLHEREINKLHGAVARDGMTLVPLSVYFNARGRAKVELALAKGKKAHDKRESIKERDWKREQGRLLRDRG